MTTTKSDKRGTEHEQTGQAADGDEWQGFDPRTRSQIARLSRETGVPLTATAGGVEYVFENGDAHRLDRRVKARRDA